MPTYPLSYIASDESLRDLRKCQDCNNVYLTSLGKVRTTKCFICRYFISEVSDVLKLSGYYYTTELYYTWYHKWYTPFSYLGFEDQLGLGGI